MWKSLDRSVWKEETGPEKEDYLITWLRRRERQGRLNAMHSTCWSLRWSLSILCFLNFLQAWDLNLPDPWWLGVVYMHPEGSVWACRGQMLLLGVGSVILCLVIWDRVSWWTWGLTWLTRLAGWQAPVMPLIWLHQDWNYRLCHWGKLFMLMLEIQTQVFMVMCQTDVTNWTVAPPLHELLACVSCSVTVFLGFSGMD